MIRKMWLALCRWFEQPTVPCRFCGNPTAHVVNQVCTPCWWDGKDYLEEDQ